MVDCNTHECKENADLIYTSKLGVKSYKEYYCAKCYIKKMKGEVHVT